MKVLLAGKFEKVLQIIVIIIILIIVIIIIIIINIFIKLLFFDIAGHTCPTNGGDKSN